MAVKGWNQLQSEVLSSEGNTKFTSLSWSDLQSSPPSSDHHHWRLLPLTISGKPSCIPTIFTCNPSKWSLAKSQWSVEILVKDLWNFVVFRSNILILFLFLHSGFGGELSFQFDGELSVKPLISKGLSWSLLRMTLETVSVDSTRWTTISSMKTHVL